MLSCRVLMMEVPAFLGIWMKTHPSSVDMPMLSRHRRYTPSLWQYSRSDALSAWSARGLLTMAIGRSANAMLYQRRGPAAGAVARSLFAIFHPGVIGAVAVDEADPAPAVLATLLICASKILHPESIVRTLAG